MKLVVWWEKSLVSLMAGTKAERLVCAKGKWWAWLWEVEEDGSMGLDLVGLMAGLMEKPKVVWKVGRRVEGSAEQMACGRAVRMVATLVEKMAASTADYWVDGMADGTADGSELTLGWQ